MPSFLYVRPDENWALYGAVADTVGATDSDFTNEWLCDGRAGRPVRSTNGTVTWTITNTAAEVGLVAVCHCDSNVNATIGGGVTATVVAGALQTDGIRLNGFATVTPVAGVTSMTVGFSGAASAVNVGEVIAGKYRSLTLPIYTADDRGERDFTRPQEMDLSSIPPYDPGLSARKPWEGTFILTTAQRDGVIDWFRAQRNGTRPSLVVPDSSVNDAWVCFISAPQYRPAGPRHWSVSFSMTEVPRVRW